MAVWVIRAGSRGEGEDFALEQGVASINFGLWQSVTEFDDQRKLRDHVTSAQAASQLWQFAHEIHDGDMVLLPRKRPRVVAVGKIIGDYSYRPDLNAYGPHTRNVEWQATDIPRGSFDKDLQDWLGRRPTVFPIRADEAERRIQRLTNAYLGDGIVADPEPAPPGNDDFTDVDWDGYIRVRIAEIIREKYPGVELEGLVAAVLEASGYTALQTRRGADGGIDVVAGSGELGFAQPRLSVQVKSGRSLVDLPDYNRLQGNVRSFGADHGLLVSMSGFTRAVHNENERSFFEIRLWDADALVQRLLEVYDKLPAEIRRDIPLERRMMPLEMAPPP